jgi:hypothetical protein
MCKQPRLTRVPAPPGSGLVRVCVTISRTCSFRLADCLGRPAAVALLSSTSGEYVNGKVSSFLATKESCVSVHAPCQNQSLSPPKIKGCWSLNLAGRSNLTASVTDRIVADAASDEPCLLPTCSTRLSHLQLQPTTRSCGCRATIATLQRSSAPKSGHCARGVRTRVPRVSTPSPVAQGNPRAVARSLYPSTRSIPRRQARPPPHRAATCPAGPSRLCQTLG